MMQELARSQTYTGSSMLPTYWALPSQNYNNNNNTPCTLKLLEQTRDLPISRPSDSIVMGGSQKPGRLYMVLHHALVVTW